MGDSCWACLLIIPNPILALMALGLCIGIQHFVFASGFPLWRLNPQTLNPTPQHTKTPILGPE